MFAAQLITPRARVRPDRETVFFFSDRMILLNGMFKDRRRGCQRESCDDN